MHLKSYEDLKDFCDLINPIIKMPIFFIDNNGILLFEICDNQLSNPLHDYRDNIYRDILKRDIGKYPQTLSSRFQENFLVLFVEIDDTLKGYLLFGPSIAHLTNEPIDLIIDCKINAREKISITRYYKSLPVINYHDLIKLGIFVHYTLYTEKIDFDLINTVSNALQNVSLKVENEHTIQYRDVNYLQRSSFYERLFYNLIKNGETDKLKELLKLHSLDGEAIVLAKNNPLRSWKNLVICFITISCRAAMDGGLSTESTYVISDVYIQELEMLNTIKDVEDFANKVFIDLAERVSRLKNQQYSKLVIMSQNYIYQNLGEDIKLSGLAQMLKVNASYLSDLFKKEVGMSLTEYVLEEKIREAKRMLLFTQFSILEIYTELGFCDQSHFTKVFKKISGLTPKQFRNSYSSSTLWC